jgi:hypothetical protein
MEPQAFRTLNTDARLPEHKSAAPAMLFRLD